MQSESKLAFSILKRFMRCYKCFTLNFALGFCCLFWARLLTLKHKLVFFDRCKEGLNQYLCLLFDAEHLSASLKRWMQLISSQHRHSPDPLGCGHALNQEPLLALTQFWRSNLPDLVKYRLTFGLQQTEIPSSHPHPAKMYCWRNLNGRYECKRCLVCLFWASVETPLCNMAGSEDALCWYKWLFLGKGKQTKILVNIFMNQMSLYLSV